MVRRGRQLLARGACAPRVVARRPRPEGPGSPPPLHPSRRHEPRCHRPHLLVGPQRPRAAARGAGRWTRLGDVRERRHGARPRRLLGGDGRRARHGRAPLVARRPALLFVGGHSHHACWGRGGMAPLRRPEARRGARLVLRQQADPFPVDSDAIRTARPARRAPLPATPQRRPEPRLGLETTARRRRLRKPRLVCKSHTLHGRQVISLQCPGMARHDGG